jgi:hypothetical protein
MSYRKGRYSNSYLVSQVRRKRKSVSNLKTGVLDSARKLKRKKSVQGSISYKRSTMNEEGQGQNTAVDHGFGIRDIGGSGISGGAGSFLADGGFGKF